MRDKFHVCHTLKTTLKVFKSILEIYVKYNNRVYYKYTMNKTQIKKGMKIQFTNVFGTHEGIVKVVLSNPNGEEQVITKGEKHGLSQKWRF